MPHLFLERFHLGRDATLGILTGEELFLYTVERPWMHNKPYESCIPIGRHDLEYGYFFRGGYDCLQLVDVPERSKIKIHKANFANQVQGCIAVGEEIWYRQEQPPGVKRSNEAFKALMNSYEQHKYTHIYIFNRNHGQHLGLE